MPSKPEFTKKWWEKHRPLLLGSTGLGEALSNWEKHCAKKPSSFKTRKEFQDAFATCDEFATALTKTRSKAGKHKDVLGYCDDYEEDSQSFLKELQSAYDGRVEAYERDRKELVKFTQEAQAAMEDILKEMKKLENYLDKTEDEATDDLNKNGGAMLKMYYEQAQPAYRQATELFEAAKKRYETDGKFIKERRGGDYNAEAYGVSAEDNERLAPIFVEATENTNKASLAYGELQDAYERLTGEYNAIVKAFFGGKASAEALAEDADKLGEVCEKLLEEIQTEIFKTTNTFPILNRFFESAEKGTLTKQEQSLVPQVFTKLEANENKVAQISRQIQALATKGLKRIPEELHRERSMKPRIDRVRMALMNVLATTKKFSQQMAGARDQAKTILDAATAD